MLIEWLIFPVDISKIKKISIYFSTNQGYNEHADLNYADKIDENKLRLEKDNHGKIKEKEEVVIPSKTNNNRIQWLISEVVILTIPSLLSLLSLNLN